MEEYGGVKKLVDDPWESVPEPGDDVDPPVVQLWLSLVQDLVRQRDVWLAGRPRDYIVKENWEINLYHHILHHLPPCQSWSALSRSLSSSYLPDVRSLSVTDRKLVLLPTIFTIL